MLSIWAAPARAELVFQEHINELCRPAVPSTIKIMRWRAPGTCTSDCFIWRLSCSNERVYDRQSAVNPWTTNLQFKFFETAPWSVIGILLPVIAYFVVSMLG